MKTFIFSICVLLSLNGCASIVSGSDQIVSVKSTPSGANVTSNPGGQSIITPGDFTLKRKDGPYRLTFTLEGYEPKTVLINVKTNEWIYGNIIGGLVGFIIDSSTGAMYDLTPSEVNVTCEKNNTN